MMSPSRESIRRIGDISTPALNEYLQKSIASSRALSALNARLDQHEAMMKAEFAELRAEILFTTRPK
jgi:hypothetical protein